MNLASHHFPAAWLALAAVLALACLAEAVRRAPWHWLVPRGRVNLWAGAVLALMLMWMMNAGVKSGLNLHLLGASAATLLFGAALGLIAVALALVGSAVNGDVAWSALGLNLLVMGVVPVLITQGLRGAVEKRLPANLFIYIFVLAFAGSWLAVVIVGTVATLLLWIAGAYPLALLLDEYLPFFVLLGFSEAWLTGMLMTLMVVFAEGWVASFDDRRYLTRKAAGRDESARHDKWEKDGNE